MSWPLLLAAPLGLIFAAAGWRMSRHSVRAADETLRLEARSSSAAPPSERSRSLEAEGYRAAGACFLVLGSAFALLCLLFGVGLLTPAR